MRKEHIGKLGMMNKPTSKNKTLLIAVVHSIQEPWLSITKNGQFETWLKSNYDHVEIQHFFSKPANFFTRKTDHFVEHLRWRGGRRLGQILNIFCAVVLFPLRLWIPRITQVEEEVFDRPAKTFRVHCLDMYVFTRWKRLSVMKHFLSNSNADYLLMTTSSSYLRPHLLLDQLSEIDEEIIYAGPTIVASKDKFVSGAQTVLNRKAAEKFILNKGKIPVHLLDDVGLGRGASLLGIGIENLTTLNISSLTDLRSLTFEDLNQNHHFRLKAQEGPIRRDVEIFHELHNLFSSSRK